MTPTTSSTRPLSTERSKLGWGRPLTALFTVVAVGACVGITHSYAQKSADETRRLHGEIARLSSELDKSSYRPEQPIQVAVAPAATARESVVRTPIMPAPAATTAAAPEAQLSTEERQRHQNAVNAAKEEAFERAIKSEARDPEWAPEAQHSVEAALSKAAVPGLNYQVDCRSTMCRVDFDYSKATDTMKASRMASHVHPWVGRGFFRVDTENRNGHTYLAREGYDFPEFDASSVTD